MNSVTLKFLTLSEIKDNFEKIKHNLSESDISKAERFKKERDRLLSYGGAYLKREAAEGREIKADEHGKPYCDGIFFNISHSVDIVGIAISASGAVGLDIEKVRDGFEAVEKLFSEEERTSGLDFFTLYTAKESLAKAQGSGMVYKLNTIPSLPTDGKVVYKDNIYFRHSLSLDGYKVSVCLMEEDFKIASDNQSLF